MNERDAFEHWYAEGQAPSHAFEKTPSGSYRYSATQTAWGVWQARAALVTQPAQEADGGTATDQTSKDLGAEFLVAGDVFRNVCVSEGLGGGAVRWVTGEDGSMAIYTRGEYSERLLATLESLPNCTTHLYAPASQDGGTAVAEPTDEQVAMLDPWMRPTAARELLRKVLAAQAAPQPEGTSQDSREGDPADIIAGALQTSRSHAYELEQRAGCRASQAAAPPSAPAKPLSDELIKAAYQKYGTGRLDGFTAAVDELVAALAKQGGDT